MRQFRKTFRHETESRAVGFSPSARVEYSRGLDSLLGPLVGFRLQEGIGLRPPHFSFLETKGSKEEQPGQGLVWRSLEDVF